jgi:uncharacterized membrane protein
MLIVALTFPVVLFHAVPSFHILLAFLHTLSHTMRVKEKNEKTFAVAKRTLHTREKTPSPAGGADDDQHETDSLRCGSRSYETARNPVLFEVYGDAGSRGEKSP